MGTSGPEREPEEGQGEGRKRIQAEGARDPRALRSFKETLEKLPSQVFLSLTLNLKYATVRRKGREHFEG